MKEFNKSAAQVRNDVVTAGQPITYKMDVFKTMFPVGARTLGQYDAELSAAMRNAGLTCIFTLAGAQVSVDIIAETKIVEGSDVIWLGRNGPVRGETVTIVTVGTNTVVLRPKDSTSKDHDFAVTHENIRRVDHRLVGVDY